MFGFGVPELLLVLAVAVLLFGPSRLPVLGRSVGEAISGLRDGLRGRTKVDAAQPTIEE